MDIPDIIKEKHLYLVDPAEGLLTEVFKKSKSQNESKSNKDESNK